MHSFSLHGKVSLNDADIFVVTHTKRVEHRECAVASRCAGCSVRTDRFPGGSCRGNRFSILVLASWSSFHPNRTRQIEASGYGRMEPFDSA